MKCFLMQIMELENAKAEAQAEARSLTAELESMRSDVAQEAAPVSLSHCSLPGLIVKVCGCELPLVVIEGTFTEACSSVCITLQVDPYCNLKAKH